MSDQVGNRAVVLGASMAGILAARVLAEAYHEVIVVDRDKVLGVSGPRRGAPHTRHAHGLHARGHLILEELFPGLTDELVSAGVPTGDLGEMRWYFNGRKLKPAHTGLLSITAQRPVLEHHVRSRVAALPNVRFLEETDILGPEFTQDRSRVVGVRVRSRTEGAAENIVAADLLVDASGRGSRTPVWLEAAGYDRPAEERVKVGLAYTTRLYRTDPAWFDGVQSINPVASPAHPRGAFFGQVAPDTCILSLTGILGDHPPTDPAGFLEFARTLPVPDVYEAIKDGVALDDPVSFGFPASVRRRYEHLRRFPENLLVMGDAVCSFNPVYGQGMSVAALESVTLRAHLREGKPPAPLRFLADVSKVIETPWEISAGGDLDFPGVDGKRTAKVTFGNAYIARLQYAATKDAEVTKHYMRVAGLIDSPQSLMRPGMALRVLRHAVRRPAAPASWLEAAGATVTALPRPAVGEDGAQAA